jgi:hypothetical protein
MSKRVAEQLIDVFLDEADSRGWGMGSVPYGDKLKLIRAKLDKPAAIAAMRYGCTNDFMKGKGWFSYEFRHESRKFAKSAAMEFKKAATRLINARITGPEIDSYGTEYSASIEISTF